MALGFLGNYETISSLESPVSDKEIVFSLWYDVSRQALLKEVKPNFACKRKYVASVDISIPDEFGYQAAYEYPSDCLKVLGLGDIDEKYNDYTVEAGYIYTDETYENGLPLRYIADVEIVTEFTPEFKILLAMYLAANTGLQITQDPNKAKMAFELYSANKISVASLSTQENKPVRIENSKFLQSKITDVSNKKYKR